MRLSALALLALFFPSFATADSMVVNVVCDPHSCDYSQGVWHSDYGIYNIVSSDGCRQPPVPAMKWLCIDWKENRAHFYFEQQAKRCLGVVMLGAWEKCGAEGTSCFVSRWDEIGCSW